MKRISVVIPCYNEAENIPTLLSRISFVEEYDDIEFVLVENGSQDNSREIIDEAVKRYNNVKMVVVNNNQGYGYGIKQGLVACEGDYIGWTHADSQVDPKDVLKAYSFLEKEKWQQSFFFKGIRDSRNRTIFERFFTRAMGYMTSSVLGRDMYDINGQPNIYPRSMWEILLKAPDNVMIETYSYYHALNLGLKEVRELVGFGKRLYGSSKLLPDLKSKLKTSKETMTYIQELKKQNNNE